MSGLFISAKEVSKVYNCSIRTAYTRIRTIKDSLSKENHQRITWEEFARYEGIPIELIEKTLKNSAIN